MHIEQNKIKSKKQKDEDGTTCVLYSQRLKKKVQITPNNFELLSNKMKTERIKNKRGHHINATHLLPVHKKHRPN